MQVTEELLENVGETTEYARQFAQKQYDYIRLVVVERTAKVASTLITTIVVTFFIILAVIMLSLTLGFYLGNLFKSYPLGFLVVAGFYCLLALVVHLLRRQLVTNPIIGMIIKDMLD